MWNNCKIYSGGRDGFVRITNADTFEVEKSIEFGVLPRAIDVCEGKMVVGLRSGKIVECNIETEEQTVVMEGHHDGEIWGLACHEDFIYTTADDNQVKQWCPNSRKCTNTAIVNEVMRA